MSLLQRGRSDLEVICEATEVLRPYLIQDVELGLIEEDREDGAALSELEVEYKGLPCSALQLGGEEKPKAEFIRRLADVCDILGRLRHPGLAQFLGVSYDPRGGSPALLVSELLPISLAACIEKHGVLPNEVSYGVIRDVALGLRYLHELRPSPFVHGDLSAKCVLLAGDFTAKISQVGVAHLRLKEKTAISHYHLPPEVTEHGKRFDRKVDVFSLGIIMLHAFTGRPPIPKDSSSEGQASSEDASSSTVTNRVTSQADLRLDYLNDLGENHPMANTILQCLKNQPLMRPHIWEIAPTVCRQAASHQNLFGHGQGMTHRSLLHCLEKEKRRKFCKFLTQVSTTESGYGSVSEAEVEELQIRCRRLSVQNETLRRISITPEHLIHLRNFCSRSILSQSLTPSKVSCVCVCVCVCVYACVRVWLFCQKTVSVSLLTDKVNTFVYHRNQLLP